MNATKIERAIKEIADPAVAQKSLRFFKKAKPKNESRDTFIGVRVPDLRAIAKKYSETELCDIQSLLKSNIHEVRLCALFLLVARFKRSDEAGRTAAYNIYMANISHIDNWDLVDSSAYFIVGPYLENCSKAPLTTLAKSTVVWERRIAIIATLHYIRKSNFVETLRLSKILLYDEHDLVQKAVGWMLREVGNRNKQTEVAFLATHYRKMPRTMLRYAIEKFPEQERKAYLNDKA